eukprot:CAMPEP_0183370960 /NCGR_PEP_ID=MMETSP0164_2-20130417/103987_1 /TAXON_ID=221442 /ORGANISM="Coccolithus pelagicus ssp braarudi, Strain PLY182g" /LENGTH=78 /DNA_ID=CAMNT_0025547443 /DNA_START=208 /DNA_END=440 /DNA_ORIENTATION=-
MTRPNVLFPRLHACIPRHEVARNSHAPRSARCTPLRQRATPIPSHWRTTDLALGGAAERVAGRDVGAFVSTIGGAAEA